MAEPPAEPQVTDWSGPFDQRVRNYVGVTDDIGNLTVQVPDGGYPHECVTATLTPCEGGALIVAAPLAAIEPGSATFTLYTLDTRAKAVVAASKRNVSVRVLFAGY